MINIFDFISVSESVDGYKSKPLIEYTYKEVKETIPNLINEEKKDELLKLMLGIESENKKEINSFIMWVVNEIKNINENENQYLSGEPDNELIMAGIQNLNKYGHYGVIKRLSTSILDEDKIMNLPYYRIFDRLLYEKEENEIQENYHKIKSGK